MSQRDRLNMRQHLAQVAAKIIMESGNRDFHAAKQKAAQQLGAYDTGSLPSNTEIETALVDYQRLFNPDIQSEHLAKLRKIALEAMMFLKPFNPKLVGSVLTGSVDSHSQVTLHIFAETIESVGFFLMDKQIPYKMIERKVRSNTDTCQHVTAYEFMVDDTQLELMVFLPKQKFIPISPVNGKPMQRADINQLEELVYLDEAKSVTA